MALIFGLGLIGTGDGTVPAQPSYASTFTTALSPQSGQSSTTATYTVAPGSGGFPGGKTVQPQVSGFGTPSVQTTTAGSTASLTFVLLVNGTAGSTATVNVAIDGMTNQTGQQSFVISQADTVTPAPTPTLNASRYDVIPDQAAVSLSGTVTGKIWPNGLYTGGTVSLAVAGTTTQVSLPSSGSGATSFTLTAPASAGNYAITPTNTAGLSNPTAARVNVFSASSGTARTIAAGIAGTRPDLRTFRRNAPSGTPAGFPSAFNKGWGKVPISVSSLSGATDGIWVRLYDALSSGASATVGTGTQLTTSPVQVHGGLSAPGTIYPLLPADPQGRFYYVEVATDAAFTSPVRLAQRVRVGIVVATFSRSQETNFANPFADGTAFTPIYPTLTVWYAGDARYPADASGSTVWDFAPGAAAGQELARVLQAQFGVGVSITGVSATSGGLDQFFAHDGSPIGATTGTLSAAVDGEFDYLTVSMGGWDAVDGAYPTETFAEDQTRMTAGIAKMLQLYPSCSVVRWCSAASGWFGTDGSRDIGYTRLNGVVRALEAANPAVVSGESTLWNEFVSGHASKAAAPDYARTAARMLIAATPAGVGGAGTSNRGATLGSTGTRAGRVISIPYTLHGGSALTSTRAAYNDPSVTYGTASPAELASTFSVYAGAGGRQGVGQAVKIDSATINTSAGTIDLVLTGTTGITYVDNSTAAMPSVLIVNYGADFGVSNTTLSPHWMGGPRIGVSLCDDVVELGIPYGRLMRPALDIAIS